MVKNESTMSQMFTFYDLKLFFILFKRTKHLQFLNLVSFLHEVL